MNDALYEQLVTRKSRPMDLVIRILCIAALVVVLCGGMLFIGSLAVLVTILLGVLIYYFVFPKLDVEYEYTLLNHDLEIDAIYSKSKRKKLMTLDIQQAEIIAPKNSHRIDIALPVSAKLFAFLRLSRALLFQNLIIYITIYTLLHQFPTVESPYCSTALAE